LRSKFHVKFFLFTADQHCSGVSEALGAGATLIKDPLKQYQLSRAAFVMVVQATDLGKLNDLAEIHPLRTGFWQKTGKYLRSS
jgi:hypothetical protein